MCGRGDERCVLCATRVLRGDDQNTMRVANERFYSLAPLASNKQVASTFSKKKTMVAQAAAAARAPKSRADKLKEGYQNFQLIADDGVSTITTFFNRRPREAALKAATRGHTNIVLREALNPKKNEYRMHHFEGKTVPIPEEAMREYEKKFKKTKRPHVHRTGMSRIDAAVLRLERQKIAHPDEAATLQEKFDERKLKAEEKLKRQRKAAAAKKRAEKKAAAGGSVSASGKSASSKAAGKRKRAAKSSTKSSAKSAKKAAAPAAKAAKAAAKPKAAAAKVKAGGSTKSSTKSAAKAKAAAPTKKAKAAPAKKAAKAAPAKKAKAGGSNKSAGKAPAAKKARK